MNLAPWKAKGTPATFRPWIGDDLSSFQREMNALVSNFFNQNDYATPSFYGLSSYPQIDLIEKNNKYMLDADIPGLNASDIDIDYFDNILTIKGEKKTEKTKEGADYICAERTNRSFRREVYLSSPIDQDNIQAEFKDGVLHVELTKKESDANARKKISIKH